MNAQDGLPPEEDHGGVAGLDPDSYTAHRLQHAMPEHLHLTTRTCFIGPVPDGWLKHHRKQWYKHHLHVHYHSRAATFHTGGTISRLRQLSGLEGPSTSAMYRHSFPRPDDIDDVDENEDDEAGEGEGQHDVITEDSPTIPVPRSTEIGARAATSSSQDLETVGAGAPEESLSSSPQKSSRHQRQQSSASKSDSFRTAGESIGGVDGPSDRTLLSQTRPHGSPSGVLESARTRESGSARGQDEDQARSGSVVSESAATAGTCNSKASLLPHDRGTTVGGSHPVSEDPGPPSESAQPQHNTAEPAQPPQAGTDPQGTLFQPAKSQPAAAGLVRFNLPGEVVDHDRHAGAQLAQLSRRRALRPVRHGRKQDGEIAKMEKMLVKIESTRQDLPDEYDENESMNVETATVKKWQEYIIICRETVDPEADFVLQFYKTRVMTSTYYIPLASKNLLRLYKILVIPAKPKHNARIRPAHQIVLGRKTTRVNLYSTLDKTVVVWVPAKNRTAIYILRPRSLTSSVEWYTFLQNALGWSRSREIQINVPDLSVTLYLEDPFQQLEAQQDAVRASSEIDDTAILRTMREEQAVAGNIIRRCMATLKSDPRWSEVVGTWAASRKMGLAWKRYDRLEWIHGAHEQKMYGTVGMQKSHDLELRPKHHYPTSVTLDAGKHADVPGGAGHGPGGTRSEVHSITEPSAIEGFLIRLTSQRGRERQMGRMFHKRLYFSTHDQFLCFSTPANAIPPPPPQFPMTEHSTVPSAHQIQEHMPLIYAVVPYRLADGEISWLRSGDASNAKVHDRDAYDEAERRVNTLLRADGYVDLCKVKAVRSVIRGSVPADQFVDEGDAVDFNEDVSNTLGDDGVVTNFDDQRTFELVLRNDLVVRLEAYDAVTKREWIRRLRELVRYWKLRKAADLELLGSIRRGNLEQLHIDEQSESYVGQFAQKWEVSQSLASAEMFHMCGISCCRTVAISGYLYWKPRRRSTFRRCSVILCHGQLLLFEASLRGRTGAEIAYSHQGRSGSIDLKDCYIYSGLVAEEDLLYQNQTATSSIDGAHPGRHALPRAYLDEDMGWWTSSDDSMTTCFVVWRALRRSYFKADADDGTNDNGTDDDSQAGRAGGRPKKHLRHVTSLGVPGRSIVFMARSRSERDRWVMSIATEIERLQQAAQEIRVVHPPSTIPNTL